VSYEHLFFDLDHTLWDFEKNSSETLCEIFSQYELHSTGHDFETFHSKYKVVNKDLWADYRKNKIDKAYLRDNRFYFSLQKIGVNDKLLANRISDHYLEHSPKKGYLFPHTHEVLAYLANKYQLHIITNGFKEAQVVKIETCGLTNYFKEIIISEEVGFNKPDKRIFNHALEITSSTTTNALMIGDDLESDIIGAKNAGINQVFFNPHQTPHSEEVTHEIKSLNELNSFL
jgi:putative hydrolase of the HAD superfamily